MYRFLIIIINFEKIIEGEIRFLRRDQILAQVRAGSLEVRNLVHRCESSSLRGEIDDEILPVGTEASEASSLPSSIHDALFCLVYMLRQRHFKGPRL
jgi:hypothetical protein